MAFFSSLFNPCQSSPIDTASSSGAFPLPASQLWEFNPLPPLAYNRLVTTFTQVCHLDRLSLSGGVEYLLVYQEIAKRLWGDSQSLFAVCRINFSFITKICSVTGNPVNPSIYSPQRKVIWITSPHRMRRKLRVPHQDSP